MAQNWYPVINTETCIECGKCIDKCTHGVYDRNQPQKPVVVYPDGCIDQCHGCGNLCPTGSITYQSGHENQNQKYEGGEPIMTNPKTTTDCGCNADCGCNETATGNATKSLIIEWRHLDVEGETCDRCYDTGENLAAEVKRLNRALSPQGIEVKYIEIKLDESQINESNGIFFNSVPIEDILNIEVSQNYCSSCSGLVGKDTYCRTIKFEGNEYEDVPAKAIRQAAYEALGLNADRPSSSACCADENDCGCGCSDTQPTKTLTIYDPAMCCPTGLCGVGVDPELLRISAALETLKTCDSKIEVNRYNLTNAPQEFVKNTEVNKRLADEGIEVLPIVVVDGRIIMTKRYPRNDELVKLLDITCDCLQGACPTATDDGCGCESEKNTVSDSCGCEGSCC